jgi:signal transduction histidine kinase
MQSEVERLTMRVDELERQRAELEDFAAMAAHEVLRPLIMTEAYAEMISQRAGHGLDLDSRRDLDALIRVSSRVRQLVQTMLSDARERQEPVRRERVDVAEIVRDCLRTLDLEIKACDAKLEIDPMPVVECDPALLSGVFGNLLSNALRYGSRQGADIHVSAIRSEAGWTFTVQSPGPPIPESERDRIFESWARARGERRSQGAGLGLAIVRHIVERHGGQVAVTSPTESSNRFSFTLPA